MLTRPSVRRRLGLLIIAAAAVATLFTTSAATAAASAAPNPPSTTASAGSATTASDLASRVLTLMNRDRKARGLRPYRQWSAVNSLALDRAQNMAAVNTLSHDAAGGSVGSALNSRGLQWYAFGEIIGTANADWSKAADYIYKLWKASSFHADLMYSRSYNYVGVGFVHRASNGTTWASVVFVDSRDHTRPVAHNRQLSRSGTTIRFTWGGHDRKLQTHTAGLASFDVQMRRDNGAWRTIRNDTTSTSLVKRHRKHGHWFWFRVQSKDRRGNLSRWTTPVRVWVP